MIRSKWGEYTLSSVSFGVRKVCRFPPFKLAVVLSVKVILVHFYLSFSNRKSCVCLIPEDSPGHS